MISVLLLFASLLLPFTSADPQTASIDLVFPRNSTYLPVYPFPIAFTLHNPSALSPYDFSFSYSLFHSSDDNDDEWTPFHESSFRFHEYTDAPLVPLPCCSDIPAGTTSDLVITHASKDNLPKNAKVMLRWKMGLGYNCSTDSGIPYDRRIDEAPEIEGRLFFTIDEEDGVLPNITAKEKGLRVGQYTIQEEFKPEEKFPCTGRVSGACNVETCPVLSVEDAQGTVFDPSDDEDEKKEGGEVTEETATEVVKGMLKAVECEGKKWPNPTATECAQLESTGAQVRAVGGVGFLVGMVAALLAVV